MLNGIELVVFDCDGVLVDSEMLASTVLAEQLQDCGLSITADDCRQQFTGRSLSSVIDMVERQWLVKLPDDFLIKLRQRDVIVFEKELRPIAGVAEVLEGLSLPFCVASSGGLIKIRHSLTLTGLINHFEPHIFSAEQVAKGKPAPDLFIHAARTMGVAPEKCLVIEDSVAGVTAAIAAGMMVLGFAGGSHITPETMTALQRAGAKEVIDNMTDLSLRLRS